MVSHREHHTQGDTESRSSAVFGSVKASTFSDTTSNSSGPAYIDSTLPGATSIGAILLIAQDTTPGREFFCWALKTTGGNAALNHDCCHAPYKNPGSTDWNSIAVFPKTDKQFYGQVVLLGYSSDRFGGLPSSIASRITANGHQLRRGVALDQYDFVLQAQGLYGAGPPLIKLPAPLFIGSSASRGASTYFGKVTRPDGVMQQLRQRSGDRDVWLWVPAGTRHKQASTWNSSTSLSHWRECNELHFISSIPPQGLQLVTGTADLIRPDKGLLWLRKLTL